MTCQVIARLGKSVSDWKMQWVTQQDSKTVSDWASQWVNWQISYWLGKSLSDWESQWITGQVSEWLGKFVGNWASQWETGQVSEWPFIIWKRCNMPNMYLFAQKILYIGKKGHRKKWKYTQKVCFYIQVYCFKQNGLMAVYMYHCCLILIWLFL